MKVYKTGGWKELIEEVEVIKVTEKSVYLSNGRSLRHTNYCSYWDTLEEAKNHLIRKYSKNIKFHTDQMNAFKIKLEELNNYK